MLNIYYSFIFVKLLNIINAYIIELKMTLQTQIYQEVL